MSGIPLTLPSRLAIVYKPIGAQEERILRDRKLVKKGLVVDALLAACLLKLGDKTEDISDEDVLGMYAIDRAAYLLDLRINTYSDVIELTDDQRETLRKQHEADVEKAKAKKQEPPVEPEYLEYVSRVKVEMACNAPHCRSPLAEEFDASMIKIYPPKSLEVTPVTLPRRTASGFKVVTLKPITGVQEREFMRLQESNGNLTDHDFLMKSIESIDGKPLSTFLFDKFGGMDLKFLREQSKVLFGHVDDRVEVECKECGLRNIANLMRVSDFLYP